jgi:hypothetical protein
VLGVDEYFVNLLAALVHLRIFIIRFNDDYLVKDAAVKDADPFILEVSDRVPHLEYFSIPPVNIYSKRVGGRLVVCDEDEFPSFEFG